MGEWAQVWRCLADPLDGRLFHHRSSRALYRKVLALRMAAEGHHAGVSPGGLSLDGRTGPAKLGLLNYIVEAGARRPATIFVPVGLAYDRVLEDRVLVEAADAGTRRFAASRSGWRSCRRF